MTVDSYVSLLSTIETNKKAKYYLAYNCKEAYSLINRVKQNKNSIDLAFFDVNLPAFEEKNISSGADLAILMRNVFPTCKIIIISMHTEPVWVNRIIESINPEGFIAKSDINYKNFPEVFQIIDNNGIYLSQSILQSHKVILKQNINWDVNDCKILQAIEQGIKTVDLPKHIPLSLSAIEKKKANMKKQLVLNNGSDKELIDIAKKSGLI